jgi:hypothetical protein
VSRNRETNLIDSPERGGGVSRGVEGFRVHGCWGDTIGTSKESLFVRGIEKNISRQGGEREGEEGGTIHLELQEQGSSALCNGGRRTCKTGKKKTLPVA